MSLVISREVSAGSAPRPTATPSRYVVSGAAGRTTVGDVLGQREDEFDVRILVETELVDHAGGPLV